MTKKLQKSLQGYLSKIKNPNLRHQFSSNSFSSKKKWILSGCKHTKTLSFAFDHDQNAAIHDDGSSKDEAATLADIDRFFFENFRSLYIENEDENLDNEEDGPKKGQDNQAYWDHPNVFESLESPRFTDPPPDVWRSHRFFMDPGSSSSLIEEPRPSLTNTSEDLRSSSTSKNTVNESTSCDNDIKGVTMANALHEFSTTISSATNTNAVMLPGGCIAVLEYSPDPHHDFHRSMQAMVEARLQHCGKIDWDYMEELLFCYMNLNNKKSHKFILSAFVDLMAGLRQNSSNIPVRSRDSHTERERNGKLRRNVT